jgi:hypothetical protein
MFTKKSNVVPVVKKPEIKKPVEVKKPEIKKSIQEVKKEIIPEVKKRVLLEGCPFKSAKQLIVNRLLGRAMTDEEISEELLKWFPAIKNGGSIPHYRSHLNSGTRYLPDGMTTPNPKLLRIKKIDLVEKSKIVKPVEVKKLVEVKKPNIKNPLNLQNEYREEKVGDVIINRGTPKKK